jgi:hypothetical protein
MPTAKRKTFSFHISVTGELSVISTLYSRDKQEKKKRERRDFSPIRYLTLVKT